MVTSTTTLPAVAFMRISFKLTAVNRRAIPCRNDVSLKVSRVPAMVTMNDTRSLNAIVVDEPDEKCAATSIADVAMRATAKTEHSMIAQKVFLEGPDEGEAFASVCTLIDL